MIPIFTGGIPKTILVAALAHAAEGGAFEIREMPAIDGPYYAICADAPTS